MSPRGAGTRDMLWGDETREESPGFLSDAGWGVQVAGHQGEGIPARSGGMQPVEARSSGLGVRVGAPQESGSEGNSPVPG